MLTAIEKFGRNEAGVTPVEYGLIAAILVVFATVAASAAGYSLADLIP